MPLGGRRRARRQLGAQPDDRTAGMFAGMALVRVPSDRASAFRDALAPLHDQGLMDVTLRAAADELPEDAATLGFEVVGSDRPGIVHEVSHLLAERGIGIVDLRTWTESAAMAGSPLFRATAVVRLPADVSPRTWTGRAGGPVGRPDGGPARGLTARTGSRVPPVGCFDGRSPTARTSIEHRGTPAGRTTAGRPHGRRRRRALRRRRAWRWSPPKRGPCSPRPGTSHSRRSWTATRSRPPPRRGSTPWVGRLPSTR